MIDKSDRRKEYFVDRTREACNRWIASQRIPSSFEVLPDGGLFGVYRKRRRADRTVRKPVTRFTQQLFQRRQLAITIGPGDVISLRQKGCRRVTTVPIEKVYRAALAWEAAASASKRKARKRS